MPKKSQDLSEFLIDELRDLYDAEKLLVKTLPKVAKAATNAELKEAISEHLDVTKGHVERLDQCFAHLGQSARGRPCKGMRGIIEEGAGMLAENLEPAVKDAAIAAASRKIEHYEIVAYESLRGVAEQLGRHEVAEILGETLAEEEEADRLLNELCQNIVEDAVVSAAEEGREEAAPPE